MRSLGFTSFVLLAATVLAQPEPGARVPRDLATLLPERTVLLVESDAPAVALRALLEFAQPLPAPLQAGALALQAAVVARTGTDLVGLVEGIAPGPAAWSIVPRAGVAPETVFVARTGDVERALALAQRLPGLTARAHGGVLALAGAASPALAHVLQDGAQSGRTGRPGFRAARPRGQGVLGIRVDLQRLRVDARRPFFESLDPGGRLYLGPIALALDAAARLTATVHVDGDELRIEGDVDASVLRDTERAILLAAGARPRPTIPSPAGTVARLDLDRSLAGWLANIERFLPPAAAARVRGEAANLDEIVGGASFVDDLLGGLEEPIVLLCVCAPPRPRDDEMEPPRIELPGFAAVARLETERAQRLLTRGFYRLSAVLSAQRVMRQLPPKIAQPLRGDGLRLHVMRGPPHPSVGAPPTEEQIEATLVFARGHAVLASTPECALQVTRALDGPAPGIAGDVLTFAGSAVADYLRRNESAFVLARVLDEGETRRQAGRFLEVVCSVLDALAQVELRVVPEAASTSFTLTVRRAR